MKEGSQYIKKIFTLIHTLNDMSKLRTTKALGDMLCCHERTVLRYIQILKELGYEITKKQSQYLITRNSILQPIK